LKSTGRHLLVEYHDCSREVLNDLGAIENLMCNAALAAKATVVGKVFHPFFPHGVSGVVVVEESHLSIHTWPEHGYAAVDFFTCGDCVPEQAHQVLFEGLEARTAEVMHVTRGMLPGPRSMSISEHRVDAPNQEDDCHGERGVCPRRAEASTSLVAMSCQGRR